MSTLAFMSFHKLTLPYSIYHTFFSLLPLLLLPLPPDYFTQRCRFIRISNFCNHFIQRLFLRLRQIVQQMRLEHKHLHFIGICKLNTIKIMLLTILKALVLGFLISFLKRAKVAELKTGPSPLVKLDKSFFIVERLLIKLTIWPRFRSSGSIFSRLANSSGGSRVRTAKVSPGTSLLKII